MYNDDTGWLFEINQKSRKKMGRNKSQSDDELKLLAALRALVRNAVVVEWHGDERHKNEFVRGIYRLVAPALLGGQLHSVKLTVKDHAQGEGERMLLHALRSVRIEKAPLGTLPNSVKTVGTAQPTTGLTASITDLLKNAIRDSDDKPFDLRK